MLLARSGVMLAMARLAALLCVVPGVGCSSSVEAFDCAGIDYHRDVRVVELADLPDVRLDVQYSASNSFGARKSRLEVIVYYGEQVTIGGRSGLAAPLHAGNAYCAGVDDGITATLNGVELSNEQPGDWVCIGPAGAVCAVPRFAIDNPSVAPDAELVLEDRSRSITIALGNLLLDRTATPVGGGDWSFHPNQTVTVRWSPATDFITLPMGGVTFYEACPDCDLGREVFSTPDLTRTQDTLAFTLPDRSVNGKLAIGLSAFKVEHRAYRITMSQTFVHDATIGP